MKTILVTGASGFIGKHVLPILLEKNYLIHATTSNTKKLIDHSHLTWHTVNLLDTLAIETLLEKTLPTHLIHLAWFAKPVLYWTSPINLEWLASSLHLLNKFIEVGGKRAVFTGSCAEYDWTQGHCHEFNTPCIPQELYGRAKYSLFLLSDMIAKQHNLSFAWARLFYLFGEHEHPDRLIPTAIRNFLNKKKFQINNDYQIRDFLYVADVADALVALLKSDVEGPVNIASGHSMTLKELINLIASKLRADHLIQYGETNTFKNTLLTADTTRLFSEIKWQPNFSFNTAIDNTITWWKTTK